MTKERLQTQAPECESGMFIHVLMEPSLYETLKAAADDDRISVPELIRRVLQDTIESRKNRSRLVKVIIKSSLYETLKAAADDNYISVNDLINQILEDTMKWRKK